jgi:hypothetical protein
VIVVLAVDCSLAFSFVPGFLIPRPSVEWSLFRCARASVFADVIASVASVGHVRLVFCFCHLSLSFEKAFDEKLVFDASNGYQVRRCHSVAARSRFIATACVRAAKGFKLLRERVTVMLI